MLYSDFHNWYFDVAIFIQWIMYSYVGYYITTSAVYSDWNIGKHVYNIRRAKAWSNSEGGTSQNKLIRQLNEYTRVNVNVVYA